MHSFIDPSIFHTVCFERDRHILSFFRLDRIAFFVNECDIDRFKRTT